MAITVSIMTGGSSSHETTSEEANGVATDFVSEGIIGSYGNTGGVAPSTGAFAVNAQGTPDMTVAVSSGVAYVTGTPTSQNSQTFRVYNSSSSNVTISANSSGSTKYDWVYIKLDATLLANPTLAGTTTGTLVTSRSTSSGTDDGTPPTYGYPVAVVTVANGASSITNATIRDIRVSAGIGSTELNDGWTTPTQTVSSVTNNGNRSYDVVFNSTVASVLSPGMRLRTTRTVTAPTYMGGLMNGSSHYFTKTTCTSTLSTVTNNFTLMGWSEPTSYGTLMNLCGRGDATPANGFTLRQETDGRISLVVLNGGAGNYRIISTYQSVPLNKKIHIAGSWASGTVVIYFDGVSVPLAPAVTAGTAPTTAGTGGDFSIGRQGAFNGQYYTGYLSGFGAFDAVLTASTIRSYMSQVLSGSETNCIGAWSLNNTGVNQQAAGTNDLTATGGVGYTSGRSPYGTDSNGVSAGTTDYALVTSVSTTTATVSVPEGCTIPTSGGVSAVAYSTAISPFGFANVSRFPISALDASGTTALPLANTLVGVGIVKPIDNVRFSAHTGTGGGTFYLSQVGSVRTINGVTANSAAMATNGTASFTVVFPFTFTTLDSYISGGYNPTVDNRVGGYVAACTATTITFTTVNFAGLANATLAMAYEVKGI